MIDAFDEPFRVLIVDDEPAARRGVAQLLEREDEFQIIGEYGTGEDMIAAVERLQPDLVFLDIQMPGWDAFESLARMPPGSAPLIVFVTGYDRYAVRAFEAHAIDYLLKPYSPERFRRACDHARLQLQQRRQLDPDGYRQRILHLLEDLGARRGAARTPLTHHDAVHFLVRKNRGRAAIVPAGSVLWAEAQLDYVRLHTADAQHLIRDTMANVERKLDPHRYVRVHRSAIVRVDAIVEVRTHGEGKLEVVLSDGSHHPVSASGRRQLEQKFGFKL